MKYLVSTSYVQVVGRIWMPSTTAAMSYTLNGYDVENARDDEGQITRESVECWLGAHAGDFSSVDDFFASIEDGEQTIEIPWSDEESELTYNDCVYGSDDE